MPNAPREEIDLATIKADIQSGEPQNIEAALQQVWNIESWQAMSSAERVDLVQTLMNVCSPDKKVNTGYWQQIGHFMMELEPDSALDLFEWMFSHPDKEMYERAAKMLTQGLPCQPSPERKARFFAFLRTKEPRIASDLEKHWA